MPRSLELFAGGGGMALGMHHAGFEHEQLIERAGHPCDILRANAERSPHLWKAANVREMDIRSWLRKVNPQELAGIDLVAGGPPCQPFSHAGSRNGHADERNMFPAALDVVRTLRPKLVVFENVPGLTPDLQRYYEYVVHQLRRPAIKPRRTEQWEAHHSRIHRVRRYHDVEYRVYPQIINAADLGVPQHRKRLFIVAIRSDLPGADAWSGIAFSHSQDALIYAQWVDGSYWKEHGLPRPRQVPQHWRRRVQTLTQGEPPTLNRWRTVRDGLAGLPEPDDQTDTPGILNHQGIPGARTYLGHTGSPIDRPCKTIKAGVHGVAGGEAMIRFPDGSLRYLTIREAARMQSFPDDYEIPGVRTQAMRAIGNAVAVHVAKTVGTKLRQLTRI